MAQEFLPQLGLRRSAPYLLLHVHEGLKVGYELGLEFLSSLLLWEVYNVAHVIPSTVKGGGEGYGLTSFPGLGTRLDTD